MSLSKNILFFLFTFYLAPFLSTALYAAEIEDVLIHYDKLNASITSQNLSDLKTHTNQMIKLIHSLEKKEQKKVLNYSVLKLEEMITTDNWELIKNNFNIVSQGLLIIIEKELPNSKYRRYYCPMEKKYWIQNTAKVEKVHNPYAPDSMPHCGQKI